MKNDSGAVGVLEDKCAILEWEIYGLLPSELIKTSSYKDSGANKVVLYQENINLFVKHFQQVCELLIESFQTFQNLFKEDEANLIDIASRLVSHRDGFAEADKRFNVGRQ